MQRSIVTFPRSLLRMMRMDWDIEWRGQGVGAFNSGVTQVVYNAFPRWVGSPKVHLHNTAIRQFRAIRHAAQGRRHVFRVPMVDPIGFDMLSAGGVTLSQGAPFSTAATFSTGQGLAYAPFALAVGAASAGATQLRIDVSPTGVAPVPGQHMSHDDRPFVVTWSDLVSGTIYDVGIQMPLRAAISDGDEVRLEAVGLFEVVEEQGGNPSYDRNRRAQPEIQLREWLR